MGQIFTMTAAGIVNGIATRSLPQMVLGANNTGAMGYLANAGVAAAGAILAKYIAGTDAATGAIVGGMTALVQRIISDTMGANFPSLGLSGDLDFDLGYYINNSFPLPTAGSGQYLLNPGYSGTPMPSVSVGGGPAIVPAALPAGAAGAVAAAASPGAGGGHDGTGRWGSRWAA